MKVRWHKSHGSFVVVTLVESSGDTALIKHGGKEYMVPRYQLYSMENPPQSLASGDGDETEVDSTTIVMPVVASGPEE